MRSSSARSRRPGRAGPSASAAAGAPWSVYLLRCSDGTLYAGATADLARRVRQHQAGRAARYTRARLPVALVWSERARDRSAALRREAALKRLTRAEKLVLVRRRSARSAPARARRS